MNRGPKTYLRPGSSDGCSMSEKRLKAYPVPEADDRAHAIVKGTIGMIPLVGSLAAEGFNEFFSPEIARRRDQWFTQLGKVVNDLYERLDAASFERLRSDPEFYSVVRHATEIAGRTHQEEKLVLLRNAIVNTGLPSAPRDDLRHIFLNMVSEFTPTHLRLLTLLHEFPGAHGREPVKGRPSVAEVLSQDDPRWSEWGQLFCQLVERLTREGLVEETLTEGREGYHWTEIRWDARSFTTPLGKEFVRFIQDRKESQ